MRRMNVAAAWPVEIEYPHMEEVEKGDFVLMWAKGKGIIGIGVADKNPFQILEAGASTQLWETGMKEEGESNGPQLEEWRIRISNWLFWDGNDPFAYKGQPRAFEAARLRDVEQFLRQVEDRLKRF
ncbi:hypothetical protein DTL42_19690 [Bremerella cremea]|uniref:EVE domain-containing protein n=2 Tax=Bremerella cremea TaxID=1031537 RepID=A0A368KNP9_9BACT|nr:hypothetical protein DTL42_19690 [Bremerella cremea]